MTDQSELLNNQTTKTDVTPVAAPAQTSAPASHTADAYDVLLQDIKTPDGRRKYATTSDAILSIPHKEQHIATLESENASLRESYAELQAKLEGVESMIEQLRNNNTSSGTNQTDQPSQSIDINGLKQEVFAELESRRVAQAQMSNVQAFKTSMAEKFGSKADETLIATAKQKGISLQTLEYIVKSDGATAAFEALGLNSVKPTTTNSVPASTRNPVAEPENNAYYKKPSKPKPGEAYAQIRAELEAAGRI